MDREHVKGAADKAKGAIKDDAGKITREKKKSQAEGKIDTKDQAKKMARSAGDRSRWTAHRSAAVCDPEGKAGAGISAESSMAVTDEDRSPLLRFSVEEY
jgi:hypothetical protein